MKLLTAGIRRKLIANGRAQAAVRGTEHERDFEPVVKLFTPDANAALLLTEIDPGDTDIAFGLCDPGTGEPELGAVSLAEPRSLRGPFGLPVEHDRWFRADKPLSAYAAEARATVRITA